MLKQKPVLEVEINGRVYEMHCQPDSPLGELHDALMQFKGYVVERMQQEHQAEMQAAMEQMKKDQIDEEEKEGS